MAKFLNPVEKARKEAKKKEIKKNKKRRQEIRSEIEKLKKQKEEEAALLSKETEVKESSKDEAVSHRAGPNQTSIFKRSHYDGSKHLKVEQKIPRSVTAVSVIESKPIIFKPKVTKFVPSSVRNKLSSNQGP